MPPKQDFEEKQAAERKEATAAQRDAFIGKQVMTTLGQPGDLRKVQVRHLWDANYRVNVLIGVDIASAKVAHSYFLVADGQGNITSSIPKITRAY